MGLGAVSLESIAWLNAVVHGGDSRGGVREAVRGYHHPQCRQLAFAVIQRLVGQVSSAG